MKEIWGREVEADDEGAAALGSTPRTPLDDAPAPMVVVTDTPGGASDSATAISSSSSSPSASSSESLTTELARGVFVVVGTSAAAGIDGVAVATAVGGGLGERGGSDRSS